MQQVIVNLVLNAQQAMNGSGEIRIAARRTPQAGLEISVEDDGPGVPAERAEEIFRPFVTTRTRGTGLGLPISRKIVESHGGTLTVERARSGGARFVILLPPLLQPSPPHPPLR
jgi:two-component system sensor kinase FixL